MWRYLFGMLFNRDWQLLRKQEWSVGKLAFRCLRTSICQIRAMNTVITSFNSIPITTTIFVWPHYKKGIIQHCSTYMFSVSVKDQQNFCMPRFFSAREVLYGCYREWPELLGKCCLYTIVAFVSRGNLRRTLWVIFHNHELPPDEMLYIPWLQLFLGATFRVSCELYSITMSRWMIHTLYIPWLHVLKIALWNA